MQPSLSDYASPVVLTAKKDGSTRLCIDYKQLNKKIVCDRYPPPLIEDQLDLLQTAKYFSTLDLKNGFFHVPVEKNSQKYTAFIVPDGHYEFRRVPFGLCNSPSIFQRFINATFKDVIREDSINLLGRFDNSFRRRGYRNKKTRDSAENCKRGRLNYKLEEMLLSTKKSRVPRSRGGRRPCVSVGA